MLFFTSDLHFGHSNIIRATQRPFDTVEEMDAALIRNRNERVSPSDEVDLLGDLTMRGAAVEPPGAYWDRSDLEATAGEIR